MICNGNADTIIRDRDNYFVTCFFSATITEGFIMFLSAVHHFLFFKSA